MESENQKLEKNIENFKNAARSVETLEKELYALEPIKDKLDRDNKSLNKQGKHKESVSISQESTSLLFVCVGERQGEAD